MCHIPITHWASVNVITWKFRRPSACRSSHENFTTKYGDHSISPDLFGLCSYSDFLFQLWAHPTFDHYDARSVIENGIFKEGKYPWHLGRFPKKTAAAVVVHCHFTLLVMGLSTAFRLWQAQQASASSHPPEALVNLSTALLAGEGTARWRQRLKEENRDKVIVFVGQVYGIFHLAELAVLSGLRLQRLPSHLGSRQDILQRYGISP